MKNSVGYNSAMPVGPGLGSQGKQHKLMPRPPSTSPGDTEPFPCKSSMSWFFPQASSQLNMADTLHLEDDEEVS